ncbi:MAG: methionyl-tRNA formyltransferase [Pseudomonadota bacterium]|jgi:methionyl-tRNA formyltransferase|nr:methionyl-tRNA formyltransferase [Pseudomonadota bacterium]MED5253856.1 methionyl-tRNA formyltransferase [Pseudomonadota bacterium]MED5273179.1 methionyl-tRNA formyltransferase [Pseudomonadota bacterium]MED5484876.1 methionyl-tRNA formyltransferase [Pseudomonadota bacterium]|tara:strand:+ start:650 stop:1594 length:945 start_codon:yes stop_codon:yes gene_type:complete
MTNNNDLIKKLKIGFMGTPSFAVPILNSLIKDNYHIEFVYTQSGRPAGRGLRKKNSEIYEVAKTKNINIRVPEKLDHEEINFISNKEIDIIIVAAYGLILPERILKIPKYGCLNVHASLLPKWRGAAPIQRSIMAGDKKTGISYMLMDKGLDTGPVILQKETQIGENDNFLKVHDSLSLIASQTISETILKFIEGKLATKEQNDDIASYADKIEKHETKIDWNLTAKEIRNLIYSLSPLPGAWTITKEGKRLKILSASIEEAKGEIAVLGENQILGCGQSSLKIKEVKPEGKKIMLFDDYLRGKNFSLGEKIFN